MNSAKLIDKFTLVKDRTDGQISGIQSGPVFCF